MSDPAYIVQYDPKALKELGKLDKPVARRVVSAVNALGENPRPTGSRTLVVEEPSIRLPFGRFRECSSLLPS